MPYNPPKPIGDLSNSTESNSSFWLWTGIAIVALLLLEPEKRKQPSQTPADLRGLEGRIRSCDAWFESTDKKGRLIHRCFIYKPTCSAKRCKADPNLLREQITEIQGIGKLTKRERERVESFTKYGEAVERDKPKIKYKGGTREKALKAIGYKEYPDVFETRTSARRIADDLPDSTIIEWSPSVYSVWYKEYSPGVVSEKTHHRKYPKIEPVIQARRSKTIPEQTSFTERSQMTLFGKLSGYTGTCLKFGKNRLGRRQCKKYSPTCGSADEGCRVEAAPLPSEIGKRTQKDYEIEADALAQELANEKNFELDYNKKLRNEILAYGGIGPHKSGFLSEEYKQIPTKYKRAEGIPMDELAQEMGTDEATLADRIYQAEASFQELKDMRGGKITTRFKKADFIDEAWNRMRSGRGFFGLITNQPESKAEEGQRLKRHYIELIDNTGWLNPAELKLMLRQYQKQYWKGMPHTITEISEWRNQQIEKRGPELFGLGYKGYDEESAINATVKNIAKFQGKPAYIFATYTGIKTKSQKPPYGQQYYRVNPDGSVDYVEYSKGVTTEKRIRSGRGFMGLGDMPSYDYASFVPNREYNAFMRKLQDTALDLLEKTHSKDIERTQGSIKISTTPGSPTFNQARSMVYPGFEAIFFEAIYNNMDKKKHNAVYQALRDEQADIQSRQSRKSELMPVKKAEKIIAEKAGQMTLFGELFGGIKFNPDVTENQIRARVIQPKKIIKGTFFVRTSTTPGVSYVMGQDKSGRVMTQSIRFARRTFDNSSAKRWFDSNIKRIKQRDRQGYVYLKPSLSGGKTHSEDYFNPRQQEMFPGLRRELALQQEDSAGIFTVDPLDTCLERQGWNLNKVRKYQQDISAKMTPDMFGKLQRLTGAEIMLQEQIQKCLERR